MDSIWPANRRLVSTDRLRLKSELRSFHEREDNWASSYVGIFLFFATSGHSFIWVSCIFGLPVTHCLLMLSLLHRGIQLEYVLITLSSSMFLLIYFCVLLSLLL